MHKRGLGRGLDALLGAAAMGTAESPAPSQNKLVEIRVDEIEVNPRQPRKEFDRQSLDELARSIATSGVIQPVVVRRTPEGAWQLIAGERRWRAAKQAGLGTIPAVVRDATDAESVELALIENLLREDLNPMEEAEAYHRVLTEFGWTQERLAERVGRDRSTIANALRLMRLPQPVQEDLRAGRLTMGHARSILSLGSEMDQLRLRDEIINHAWTVRATERTVEKRRATPPPARHRSVELVALEEAIQRALVTRVRLVGSATKGRIEIAYSSTEELDRLAQAMGATT